MTFLKYFYFAKKKPVLGKKKRKSAPSLNLGVSNLISGRIYSTKQNSIVCPYC